MVRVRNVGQHDGVPPAEGGNRAIETRQRLYGLDAIELLLGSSGENRIRPVTRKAREELEKLGWDHSDLFEVIGQVLALGEYIGSEWCALNDTGSWAACDAYRYRRVERVPAGMEMLCEYYFKWAIGRQGDLLLLVSCHLSRG